MKYLCNLEMRNVFFLFCFWTLYRFGGLDPTENIYKREQTHFWSDEFETAVQVQLGISLKLHRYHCSKAFSIIGSWLWKLLFSTEIYSVIWNLNFFLLLLCYFKKIWLKLNKSFNLEIFAIYIPVVVRKLFISKIRLCH